MNVTHRGSSRPKSPLAQPSLVFLFSRWRNRGLSLLVLFFFSVAVCRFPNTGDDWYVLVGVARDMILNPKSVAGGFIYTYRLVGDGEKLEFVHKVGSSLSAVHHGCDRTHFSFSFLFFFVHGMSVGSVFWYTFIVMVRK